MFDIYPPFRKTTTRSVELFSTEECGLGYFFCNSPYLLPAFVFDTRGSRTTLASFPGIAGRANCPRDIRLSSDAGHY